MKKLISIIMSCLLLFNFMTQVSADPVNDTAKGNRPKVSVIVPVYKVEPWLHECMDSLVNQTLKDIEIICVDDGSPDNCGKILDEYAAKDNRVKVIHQKNQGVSVARNVGLDIATGEYITFVDSDDYIEKNTYEVAYRYAKKDNVDVLNFGFRTFDDGKDDHSSELMNPPDVPVISNDEFIQKEYNQGTVWNYLFKYDLIQNNKLRFMPEITWGEDTCFLFMVLGIAKSMKYIPAKFYNYRMRTTSCIHTVKPEEKMEKTHKMPKFVKEFWINNNVMKNKEQNFFILIGRWVKCFHEACVNYAQEILNVFDDFLRDPNIIKKCLKDIKDELELLKQSAKANKRSIIPIAMATDNNYIMPTIVAMTSVLENKNESTFINFHVMLSGIVTDENIQKLKKVETVYKNCSVDLIDMKDKFSNGPTTSNISTPMYYRLNLPSLLPQYDKVIYLDTDTITKKDLSELYSTPLEENYVAAVIDCCFHGDEYMQRLDIPDENHYVNSGVLLMNLKKMRIDKIENKFNEYVSTLKARGSLYPDQDTLNAVCYGKIKLISSKYNTAGIYSPLTCPKERDETISDPVVIHYFGSNKPWKNHSYKIYMWWRFYGQCEYYEIGDIWNGYYKIAKEKFGNI